MEVSLGYVCFFLDADKGLRLDLESQQPNSFLPTLHKFLIHLYKHSHPTLVVFSCCQMTHLLTSRIDRNQWVEVSQMLFSNNSHGILSQLHNQSLGINKNNLLTKESHLSYQISI